MKSIVLRSPNLADGGDVHVVNLHEVGAFARGGLAHGRDHRKVTLHLTGSEVQQLRKRWGEPRVDASTKTMEYAFPRDSLKRAMKAEGGQVGGLDPRTLLPTTPTEEPQYLRKRSTTDIPDYYTYGMGPEHQFYENNVVADQPTFAHVPTTPTGPTTQSGGGTGSSQSLAAVGGALAGGAKLADALGYGGTLTKGASTLGNALSGNWLGAAKSGLGLYQGLAGSSLAGIGSGAAANAALADAGFLGGWATPSVEATLAGASGVGAAGTGAAGAGAAGSSAAGAGAGAAGAEGAAAGSGGLGALGTAGLGAAYAAAVIGAGKLIHKAFNAHGSTDRNRAAFEQNILSQWGEPVQVARIGAKGMFPLKAYNVPGKGWVMFSQKQLDDLAGNYYGAAFAPDGNQAEWQQKLEDQWNGLQPITADYINQQREKLGGSWDDAAIQKILGGHAHGGAVGGLAQGGAFSPPGYVKGPGTGRSDSIPAQLSDGEYVLTAEDVALLGDGSNEAGARRLDQMRREIRMHKGGALSRGKISPDALSPLQYMTRMK